MESITFEKEINQLSKIFFSPSQQIEVEKVLSMINNAVFFEDYEINSQSLKEISMEKSKLFISAVIKLGYVLDKEINSSKRLSKDDEFKLCKMNNDLNSLKKITVN